MSKVRFTIDYTQADSSGLARLDIARHEDGMIGYGVMKPMLFQQLLDGETPSTNFAAMTDMWSDGEIKAFLQSALDSAWRLGLRPQAEARSAGPDYAYAEVSPAVRNAAEELRARALAALGTDQALAA